MENEGNNVIRYLMSEMDPSQEVLMERAMMEDDNLLIEVESMRQTMRRLDELPQKQPPKELTVSILEMAEEHSKSWYNILPAISPEVYKYAAVLLLGVGLSSGYWLITNSSSNSKNANSANTASLQSALPASLQAASSQNNRVEPWVDHNNVLYFQDQFNSGSTAYKSIIEASMKKVTPLQGPFIPDFRSQSLQLTGVQQ